MPGMDRPLLLLTGPPSVTVHHVVAVDVLDDDRHLAVVHEHPVAGPGIVSQLLGWSRRDRACLHSRPP